MAPAMAQGDTLSVSINPGSPEQGVPAAFAFSGNTQAVNQEGQGPVLEAEYRPAGGIGCQDSMQDDFAAAGGASTILAGAWGDNGGAPWDSSEGLSFPPPMQGPGSFGNTYEYAMPNTGTYLLCAYLEHNSDPESGNATPVVDASTSVTFSVSPPKVEIFSAALAAPAQPGQLFTINYTTQTDQQLRLESIIVPGGGLPCGENASLFGQELRQDDQSEQLGPLFSEDEPTLVFGGPTVTQATDTERLAGPYVLCSWIEGPNQGEVDAALATPLYVDTPPSLPPSPASDACLHDREGVAHYELIVRRYERRLKAHHLSRKTRRSDSKVLARARKALSKDRGLRRGQCPGGM